MDTLTHAGASVPIQRKDFDYQKAYPKPEDAPAFGDWLRAALGLKSTEAARKSLSVGDSGGQLVPEHLMGEVLAALQPATAVLRAGAGLLDLSSRSGKSFSWAAVDELPTFAWRAEGDAIGGTAPSFRLVEAVPRSIACTFTVTRELVADASNIDAAIRGALVQALAIAIDAACLRGTGADDDQPVGLLHHPDVVQWSLDSTGTSIAQHRFRPLLEALAGILEDGSAFPGAAVMSPRVWASFESLTGLDGMTPAVRPRPLEGVQMLYSAAVPVEVDDSYEVSDAFLGDWRQMLVALREPLSVSVLTEAAALTGELTVVAHARLDVAVLQPKSFRVIRRLRPTYSTTTSFG